MIVIGLTGSIGMGKTTTAAMFAAEGVPVFDADRAVHALYAGAAVEPVEALFPGVSREGRIDRALLGARVVDDRSAFEALEAVIHPLVGAEEEAFLKAALHGGHAQAVLDIPLLLETGGADRVDVVVLASAPAEVQRARVLARGIDEARFAAILARQMPDAQKRRRTHFIVDTGRGMAAAQRAVRRILRATAAMQGKALQARLSALP